MIYGSQNVSTHNSTCNPHSHVGGGRLNILTLENRLTLSLVSLSVFPLLTTFLWPKATSKRGSKASARCSRALSFRTSGWHSFSVLRTPTIQNFEQSPKPARPSHTCVPSPDVDVTFPSWLPSRDSQTFTNPLHRAHPSHLMSGDPCSPFQTQRKLLFL